ncbi:SubName: Full=Uncharacterized protein {ECO:0000313/EMBL:CCA74385.1} [Serendipita indica DSM 11827]|uniref:Transmembrane protein n=1 Tax=Serendipita indica (strain DSM 11827) TaxID=1109443 RepID=G4TSV0_SERID|nr:SubName: Full=Uncharacterized protein {ECO:0000313/EMBL:CCA74385.1} [Serendipita indica DSM 11827]CCA74385.1 hypothetical protein PIIN_08337 [Serendipita indica DSM 11827]
MQVNEVPTSRPLSVPGRDLVGGGATYDGVSSSYLGDGGKSPWPRDTAYDSEEKAGERPNPHRKYSKKWFDYARNRAVEVGRWPRVTYASIGIILIVVWVGIMIVFAKSEVKAQRKNSDYNGGKGRVGGGASKFQLLLKGTLKKFDPIERNLRVSWALVYVDNTTGIVHPSGETPEDRWQVNLYRDVKAVPEDRQGNATLLAEFDLTQAELESTYRVDNVTQPPIATLGMHPFDSVDTNIDFNQAKEEDAFAQPLFAYPFDVWQGSIVFAITDRVVSDRLNLTNNHILNPGGAILRDSTLNWRIQLAANNTCDLAPVDAGCELHLDFTGRRPPLVKFAAILAVMINWASTIGIFLLTCESVVMRRTYILSDTDILGVCVSALFALPSVRAILPGAPDFGAIIDLIGIIPNIIVVSLCTTAIALSKLTMRRPKNE